MEIDITSYIISFLVGGAICALAQILVVRTTITTSRILVLFLTLGVVLQTLGVYPYFKDFAKAGATVPIIGFGATLAKGAIEGAKKAGFLGVLQGGLTATAGGIAVAIVSAFLVGLIFNSRTKHIK